MDFTVKRILRRVLRRGSGKGGFSRCLEPPLAEYDPLGLKKREGVPEMGTKPLKALWGHRASNRGSEGL